MSTWGHECLFLVWSVNDSTLLVTFENVRITLLKCKLDLYYRSERTIVQCATKLGPFHYNAGSKHLPTCSQRVESNHQPVLKKNCSNMVNLKQLPTYWSFFVNDTQ